MIAAAEGVVAAMGWRRAVPPEPPPIHRHERFKCQFGSLPIAIEFDLCDSESWTIWMHTDLICYVLAIEKLGVFQTVFVFSTFFVRMFLS